MSHLSISNSKTRWRRLRRDLSLLLVGLIALELVCRVPTVNSLLAEHLDPYENLLWYDWIMPAYQEQLRAKPGYDVWLLGSSYMMTSLDPQRIQSELRDNVTVQNYGFTRALNFNNVSDMVAWLFTLDRPRYVVIGTTVLNFNAGAANPVSAYSSPYESVYIFRDSPDDAIAGFLYRTSAFYRYAILARNATFIPIEQTLYRPIPYGGFVASETVLDCDVKFSTTHEFSPNLRYDAGLARLEKLIETVQEQGIQVAVINVPLPACALDDFGSYAAYEQQYLNPLAAHLASRQIPFFALDPQFYAEVPLEDQEQYFANNTHANQRGADLFSEWSAKFVADWLETLE